MAMTETTQPAELEQNYPSAAPPSLSAASVESYELRDPIDYDALLAKMRQENPNLAKLLDAKNLEETRRIVKQLNPTDHQGLMGLLRMVGFRLGAVRRHEEALAASRAQVEIARLGDPTSLDHFFGNGQQRNLGDALTALGDGLVELGSLDVAMRAYEEAEECYEEDARLKAAAGQTRPSEFDRVFGAQDFRSQLYSRISSLHQRFGNHDEAARFNQLAWEHSKRRSDPQSQFEIEISKAKGAREHGDLERALNAYWRALDLALTLTSSSITGKDVVEALAGIADVHAALGLHRTAISHRKRCIELNSKTAHRGRLLSDHRELARSLAALGDADAALHALNEALRLCAVPLSEVYSGRSPFSWREGDTQYVLSHYDDAWRVLLQRARLQAQRDREAAIKDLEWGVRIVERLRRQVLSSEHRVGAQEGMIEVYDELIRLHADQYAATGRASSAKAVFLNIERAKSRVLAEMLSEQALPAPPSVPAELIASERKLMIDAARLREALMRETDDPVEISEALDKTLEELNAVLDQIEAVSPDGGPEYVALRRAEPVDADAIAALLREAGGNVVLVNYYLLSDQLLIVILDPELDAPRVIHQAVGRGTVRDWVMVNPASPPSPDLRLAYWSLDFGPLLISPLASSTRKGVGFCLVPHDALHALPLHALEPEPGADPLVHSAPVSYIPSASLLRFILRRPRSKAENNLVLGNPTRADAGPIEHTRNEAEKVAGVLACSPYLGTAATCQVVKQRIADSRMTHIACHHLFNAEAPMQSALLLTDGDLTAQCILQMKVGAELVTLSACQSGVSEQRPGDELIGMVRALIFAGARSVVVSLWNAYDEATANIMREFYEGLVNRQLPKREALQLAQLTAAGLSKAQWAPFVLVGDWR
jgi:tetratricopeptide (TPR) repeat protein